MQSCRERVKQCDAMSIPVGVTYQGKNMYNTCFGGCITLILGLYIGALFVTSFI